MRLSSHLWLGQGCQICDHYDYNTSGGKAGLKVLVSQHFTSGEDVNIKLLTSRPVRLDVYTDKDSSEWTMGILYRITKKEL